ncbi:hypothetical protein O181_090914 [Austropuccinia psidii MF-1]|uniref:Uncharacterized protein n=1 Tax=Austropuccinia psidii MF-1 TaxID=1389203 RepID=A0A9Q3IWI4_9BASI|nr:hypothetical protein [Austropuccinia psidii MF-1]
MGLHAFTGTTHQGESRVNCRRLTLRQANVKQDKSQAHVKQKSSEHRAHVLLLSYTKSCDIHQYWFPCALNSDSSPPDHPATVQWLVKITQDPPVCTKTHQRGPSANLDVGGGFDFTRSSIRGLRLSGIFVLQVTLVEPSAQYRVCGCACVSGCARAASPSNMMMAQLETLAAVKGECVGHLIIELGLFTLYPMSK